MLIVELLYMDECPTWKEAFANLEAALEAEEINGSINLVKIETSEQARKERFLGSPSFRAHGVDLWPEEREDYSLSCRIYHTPAGLKGFPTIEMLRERLKQVLSTRPAP